MLSHPLHTVSQPRSPPRVNHTNPGSRDCLWRARGSGVIAASQRSPSVLIRTLKLYSGGINSLQSRFHPRASRSRRGICRVCRSFTMGPQTRIISSATRGKVCPRNSVQGVVHRRFLNHITRVLICHLISADRCFRCLPSFIRGQISADRNLRRFNARLHSLHANISDKSHRVAPTSGTG